MLSPLQRRNLLRSFQPENPGILAYNQTQDRVLTNGDRTYARVRAASTQEVQLMGLEQSWNPSKQNYRISVYGSKPTSNLYWISFDNGLNKSVATYIRTELRDSHVWIYVQV